jgi:hypothetical protein
MDSISKARDFFINQQGLSPDQADMIVSKGMEAYNEQTQPQSMMQMASGGIARLGYGFGNLVKGSGVAEPVSGGEMRGSEGGFGMNLIGRLIQQNPQMFRRVETMSSKRDFIDQNQNGIDDRQEAAYGGRIGYQMGGSPIGIQSMPMDYGTSLQIPTQQQPMFTSTGNATSSPLLNYGQTNIGKAGGTPLTRNGYQEGGLTDFYKAEEPIIPRIENIGGLLDKAEKSIGEPQNNFTSPLATTFSGFNMQSNGMQDGGIARLGYQMGGDVGMPQEQGMQQLGEGDTALLTIIQLLIEQGIDPQIAEKLARQILQIFAQGGEPALDQFISQLEQEEVQAMASGGIAGLYPRQGYFVGRIVKGISKAVSGAVKGVAKAVKSVAKSPIGRIALTIGATMLMGPAGLNLGAGVFGASNAFLAGAINAGAANLLVQGITTGKFNPKEALLAAGVGGLTSGLTQPGNIDTSSATSNAANITSNAAADITASPVSSASTSQILSEPSFGGLGVNQIAPEVQFAAPSYSTIGGLGPTPSYTGLESNISSMTGTGYAAPKPNLPFQLQGAGDGSVIDANAITNDYSYPGTIDKLRTSASNYGTDLMNKAQTGIQNLYKDPLGTIAKAAGSVYETAKENAIPAGIGFATGYALGAPQGENESDEDFAKRQQEEVNPLITYYGRNLQIKNPYFYQKFGATNPFETAAQGGIMGYKKGGSMIPPARQIEGGVIELDARKTGGYIPYGKKERVDDVPAMLAKDEFVFTSRAVKAAGNGSAKRGAKKMYALMKQLESKGARA